MKKVMMMVMALMLALSPLAFAGGDQNCGSKAQGPAGGSGQGTVKQNRAAAD